VLSSQILDKMASRQMSTGNSIHEVHEPQPAQPQPVAAEPASAPAPAPAAPAVSSKPRSGIMGKLVTPECRKFSGDFY